jgi:hypothetical protein
VWYLLQIIVFSTVVYKYVTEITPTAHVGHILLFAYLMTWLTTKLLSVLLDTIYKLQTKRLLTAPSKALTLRGRR